MSSMSLTSADVLFVGYSNPVLGWYRTGMQAFALGCDWILIHGKGPGDAQLMSALSRKGNIIPPFGDYKVIFLQQPRGREWLLLVRRLRAKGIKVIYEIDDHLHSVRKLRDHAANKIYTRKFVEAHEMVMRECDGVVVSTDFLAQTYRKINPRVWVCKNAIEGRRYRGLVRPHRPETVNIGWAGGVGHRNAFLGWLPAIEQIMDEHPETRFVSIGEPMADLLDDRFGRRRLSIPMVTMENYPAVMCNFDIALAPAGRTHFYRGKSDLRWLEASGVGTPAVVDPFVYDQVPSQPMHAYLADTNGDCYHALATLVPNQELRSEIGERTRRYVMQNRNIDVAVEQWETVIKEVFA
jgi:glycosyltransferase involved in cell wall biosynthesis